MDTIEGTRAPEVIDLLVSGERRVRVRCWPGHGRPLILLHGLLDDSLGWAQLAMDTHRPCLAVDLPGFGGSDVPTRPRISAYADAVCEAIEHLDVVPSTLVGHSLGGAVALQAALRLGDQLSGLIVFEPILFYMLAQHGPADAFAEINALATDYHKHARASDWESAGALFVDYWSGKGTWAAVPPERKAALLKMLPNVVNEWDAVISPGPPLAAFDAIDARTHLVRAADTRRPTHAIATLLTKAHSDWRFQELPAGGHMAPVSRPDLFNPLVDRILAELR
jgi:pimeloyl-ACP methyl ester carboxylesterase